MKEWMDIEWIAADTKAFSHQVLPAISNIAELYDRAKVFQLPSPSRTTTTTTIASNHSQQIRIGWFYTFILATITTTTKKTAKKARKKNLIHLFIFIELSLTTLWRFLCVLRFCCSVAVVDDAFGFFHFSLYVYVSCSISLFTFTATNGYFVICLPSFNHRIEHSKQKSVAVMSYTYHNHTHTYTIQYACIDPFIRIGHAIYCFDATPPQIRRIIWFGFCSLAHRTRTQAHTPPPPPPSSWWHDSRTSISFRYLARLNQLVS